MVSEKNYVPIYFNLKSTYKDLDFSLDSIFNKLLPDELEWSVTKIGKLVLEDFAKEVQQCILIYSK